MKIEDILNNWITLNKHLMTVSEKVAGEMLAYEQANRARIRVMLRIYNRLSKLRSQREKRELAQHAKA